MNDDVPRRGGGLAGTAGLLAGATVLAGVYGGQPAFAEDLNWNMATPYPDTEFITQLHHTLAADIEQLTDGEFTITVHSTGSLFKNPEIKRATQMGQAQLGTQLMQNLGPENAIFDIDAIPFLVRNYEEMWTLYQITKPRVEEVLNDNGLKLLYAVPWGFQQLYTNTKVGALADIKGLRQRAYNAATSELAALMGTEPTTVQIHDVGQAFATGMIDMMNTSSNSGVSYELWEIVDHMYDIRGWNPKQMAFMNKSAWDSLSPELQSAVMVAARKAEGVGWKQSLEIVKRAPKQLEAGGMEVIEPSDKLMSQLYAIGVTMRQTWAQKADAQANAAMAEFLAAVGRD